MNATTAPTERADTALTIAATFGPVVPLCWPTERGSCGCGGRHEGHDIGKAPLTEHGFKDASTDPDVIAAWARKWPAANWGIDLERAGLVFVGPDTDGGRTEAQSKGLTPSVVRKSSNDGMLYRRTPDTPITSAIGKGDSGGIDVKSNGYAVVYGRHQDGSDIYLEPCEALLAPVPPWANAILRQRKAHSGEPLAPRLTKGQRHDELVRITGAWRRAGLTTDEVLAGLRAVNDARCEPLLDADELRAIAESTTDWYRPPKSPVDTSATMSEPDDTRDLPQCCDPQCAAEKAALRDQLSRLWRVKRNPNLPAAVADTALKMVYEAESAERRLANGAPVMGADGWTPLYLGHPSRDECERRSEAKVRGEDPGPLPRHGWAEDLGRSPKTVRTQLTQLEEWGIATLRRAPARVGNRDVEIITGFRLNDTTTATLDRLETFDPTENGYTPPGRRLGLICPSCRDETKIVLEATATCADCELVLAATKQTVKPDAAILRVLFPREIEIAERVAATPVRVEDFEDPTIEPSPTEGFPTTPAMVPDSIGKGFQWDGPAPTFWDDPPAYEPPEYEPQWTDAEPPPGHRDGRAGPAPPDEAVPRFAEYLA